jgi:hypothetical protein
LDTQVSPQACCPDGQLKPQLVPSQVAVAPGGGWQAMQDVPQLWTELLAMHVPEQLC